MPPSLRDRSGDALRGRACPALRVAYAFTETGATRSEYTIVRRGEDDYYLVSAGAWADYDADNLCKMADDMTAELGPVVIQDVTAQWGAFALAGPDSRAILFALIRHAEPASALSNKRFPWL